MRRGCHVFAGTSICRHTSILVLRGFLTALSFPLLVRHVQRLNGDEATKLLRAKGFSTPVIALTGMFACFVKAVILLSGWSVVLHCSCFTLSLRVVCVRSQCVAQREGQVHERWVEILHDDLYACV